MDRTVRESIIACFTGFAKKHRRLQGLCMAALFVSLLLYYFGRHFVTNGKRYASMAFVAVFFMSSCSFSFAVFAERTGFTSVQETYSAIVEDSDVSLAAVEPLDEEQEAPVEEPVGSEYSAYDEGEEQIEAYTLDDLLERHDDSGLHEGTEAEDAKKPSVEEAVFDAADWRLALINKQHPIPADYDFTLGAFNSGMLCDERVIEDLLLMMKAAKKDGVNLEVCSAYRGDNRQEFLFEKKIKNYMGQGMSYMESYKRASQTVTVPGASEHQVGLAQDIWSASYKSLDAGFGETEAGKWLARHSHEYGFILRYPAGKEHITSIEYEPWHFRYVGREAAKVMQEEGLCLEEFWDKYLL